MYFLKGYGIIQYISIISTVLIQVATTQCPCKEVSIDEEIKESLSNLVNLLVRKSLADMKIPSFDCSGKVFPAKASTDNQGRQCGRKKVQIPEVTLGLASPGDWPWHVGIFRVYKDSDLQFLCGGTLLTKNRILTAAHCVQNEAKDRLFVYMGNIKISTNTNPDDSNLLTVSEKIVHPSYDNHKNDIAMLILSSPLIQYTEYIQPICLQTEPTNIANIAGKYGYIAGWSMDEDDNLSTELKTTPLQIRTHMDCIQKNPSFFSRYLTENSFCAGNRNGIGPCKGEGGGGLYTSEQDKAGHITWYLRGILSLAPLTFKDGLSTCDTFQDLVFTDVSKYLSFIDKE